jgi:hypothetical protein
MRRRSRHRQRVVNASSKGADREYDMLNDVAAEITADELREFLEADSLGVRADPVFKERLRRSLWELVCARFAGDRTLPDEDA